MQNTSCAIRNPVVCLSQLNGNVTDNDTDIVTETDTKYWKHGAFGEDGQGLRKLPEREL